MTVKEKLMQEFGAAIEAVFGDLSSMDEELVEVDEKDIDAIANKVKFYLDLK